MKTFNLKRGVADWKKNHRAAARCGFILCCAFFFAAALPLLAQMRVIRNFPPGMGNPSPSGGDSSGGPKNSGSGPWIPSEALASAGSTNSSDTNGIQLSFQGASVDMVAQWLSQTTDKTVIKNPQVQCQLTIMSAKKMPVREAVNMVYRALALQGFSVVELSNSILIVPAGQEPKMSPEVVTGSTTNLPEGRQLLLKVFQLRHIQAADAKNRIQTALSDKGSADVDETANQIIVTDYNDNLRVVGDLIDALDNDHPVDMAVRTIPLKNIPAEQLAKELQPLYEKMGNKTTIDVAADDRSNTLIVLSSLEDFGTVEKLTAMLDVDDAKEKAIQTFTLKNADAQDVAKQLQDLNQNQTSSSRYTYYFSPQPEGDKNKFSVVADRRRNAIIVQAPPVQMDSLAKMIAELDEPVADDGLAPQIYPLKYVSASDIEDVLNDLFLKKTQQRSYWDFFDDNSDDSSSQQDAGRLYGKVRITSEPYANAIIVTSNSKENLAVIDNVLKQLDQPSQAGESTLRVCLKYAKADTVANSLNILFAKNGSPAMAGQSQQNQNGNQQGQSQSSQQNSTAADQNGTSQSGFDVTQDTKENAYYPWIGGQPDNTGNSSGNKSSTPTVSDLVGRVRCVADQRGNAVLISANVHFFPQIMQLIQDVDAPADRVMIEARIIQVSSDYLNKLGVRWSPNGSAVFSGADYDDSFLGSVSGNYQKGFGGNTTVNTPYNGSPADTTVASVAQTLVSLRSGMVSSTFNIDFLVQFMREKADASVLGEPNITINDNEVGKLFVGQEVPVQGATQISSVGSQNTTTVYKNDVGVTLEVIPHINSDGDVQLNVHVESSSIDAAESTTLNSVVFDTDQFHTEATAKKNETLLLGGIIQKQTSNTIRKFPILGDIPGLGWAFKKKDQSTQNVELMVFLRPVVIHTEIDADKLREEFDNKTPLLQQWQKDSESGSGSESK